MRGFELGLSALRAQQQTLQTLGNNIANAATPGYHRQQVHLASRAPLRDDRLHVGAGVEVTSISRLRSAAIETALRRNVALAGTAEQILGIQKQIETLLNPGDSSIHSSLSTFFNKLQQSANAPQDLTVRREFLTAASDMVNSFNQMDQALADLRRDITGDLKAAVDDVNGLLRDLGALNLQITQSESLGGSPNDLYDRRDQLLTDLAKYLDVDVSLDEQGREVVSIAGGALVVGPRALDFQVRQDANGNTQITRGLHETPVPIAAGGLQAMLEGINETVPAFRTRLATLAKEVVRAVDEQHARGITDRGGYRTMVGQRSLSNVTDRLTTVNSDFPINTGDVYVTVTQLSTGIRHTSQIHVDMTTDSLTDVAAAMDAVAGLTATVDPVRRSLTLSANADFAFDFSGLPDNFPDVSGMTGTTIPQLSGSYTGTINDQWTVSFSGPGDVGVTDGLQAVVTDRLGQVIGRLDVGAGYEAGTPLLIQQGISLRLAAGSVNAGDSFTSHLVTDSDSTGLLAALGLNSIFTGSSPGNLGVRTEILNSPEQLAVSRTGVPGDAFNIAAIGELRDVRFDSLGGRSFVEEMADVTAESGLDVQSAESSHAQLLTYRDRLQADRDSVSGVDINEETLRMMEAERGYQAAARFISTFNSMMDELMQFVK